MRFPAIVLAIVMLSACGGGSPPAAVTPPPSALPSPIYSVEIVWTGVGGAPTDMDSQDRRRLDASGSAMPTPGPIVLTEPDCTYPCQDEFEGGAGQTNVTASLAIAPEPASTSIPSFSTNSSDVSTVPVAPNGIATPAVTMYAVAPGDVTTATLTGSMTSPTVSAQQTIFIYGRLNVLCPVSSDTTTAPEAVSITNGQITAQTSPSAADVYIDGPNCPGVFHNTTESFTTVHFPYGVTTFGSYPPSIAFPDVTTSLYSNSATAITIEQFTTPYPAEGFLFQTASGQIVKWLGYATGIGGTSTSEFVAGPYAQHSFAV